MLAGVNLFLAILSCAVFVKADVSHLGYDRYRGQRVQSLRSQRLEAVPTPYPAAGYRPNREFNLPRDQPIFPLASQHTNRPHINNGFDDLSEPQKPQLTYGGPQQEPRFRPEIRPQNFNGFNSLASPQHYQPSDANQQSHINNNDFNNFEPSQQIPSSIDDFNSAADEVQQPQFLVEQTQFSDDNIFNSNSNNFPEPQQPELLYGAPNNQEEEAQSARLRQHLVARLHQAQRLEKLQQQHRYQNQQFFNTPQNVYSRPPQQQQLIQEAQAESKRSRLIVPKPARLTDNREEIETESDVKTSETEEIETTTKAQRKNTVHRTANTPAMANTNVVNYYPATAFGFVQPFNGAYVAPTTYPLSAPYTLRSPFLSHPYALAGTTPAQLRAW